ncbi:histidinol-phosphate transaminase [Buchnera aphidicola (Ceratovacuna keduensis)]|uniref:histidinol-phosphate transaminase n=1 Tax=Buchnera aphidicola TaxID=9 RepID=UPI0031B85E1B
MNFKKLVKFNIKNFVPYKSARNICVDGSIWLNANESPINNELLVLNKNLNRYPNPQPKNIILKYSKYSKVNVNNILISRGIDESIELFIKVFCKPNIDKIMYFSPTYDMYRITAKIFGIDTINVFLKDYNNFDYNIIKKNIKFLKLIYICRPNNPTGDIMPEEILINILNFCKKTSLVIVDEAYIEFCYYKSVVKLIKKYSNLVVLRTMSKAFGLASVRCGFSIANLEIINILKKFIAPYPISTPTCNIVDKFLSNKFINFMKKTVLEINENKNWLFNKLKKINFIKKVFESFSNYILIKCVSSDFVIKKLESKGIILRDQSKNFGLKNCIRISIGTKLECKKLIYELKNISYKNVF